MSWLGKERARWKLTAQDDGRPFLVDVETSWLRSIICLNLYMRHGEENMDDERLGRRIDNCLVEFIRILLWSLQQERIPIEVVKEAMAKIEMGMREDSALKAYARTLMRDKELPLASATYLDLAKRQVLYGGKPAATSEEGKRFVSVFLAQVMKKKYRNFNLDREGIARNLADYCLIHRDPGTLRSFILHSEVSRTTWDALKLVCKDSVESGEVHLLPPALLEWYLGATIGRPRRPDVAPAPGNRPRTIGHRLRNNEIRNTVELLDQVGMPEHVACKAVADAFGFTEKTISKICQKPYWTMEDLIEDGLERLAPHLVSHPYSDSQPSYTI